MKHSLEQEGRRYIKLSFDPHRMKTVALSQGLAQYSEEELKEHYLNTGRQYRQFSEKQRKRGELCNRNDGQ
jgi:hypothetical protein